MIFTVMEKLQDMSEFIDLFRRVLFLYPNKRIFISLKYYRE